MKKIVKKAITSVLLVVFVLSVEWVLPAFAEPSPYREVNSDASRSTDFEAQLLEKKTITNSYAATFETDHKISSDKEIVLLIDSSGALSKIVPIKDPFEYGLFSGGANHTLRLTGTNMTVNGKMHSNYDIYISGSNFHSNDGSVCESVYPSRKDGNIDVNFTINEPVPMPDLTENVKDKCNNIITENTYRSYLVNGSQMIGQNGVYLNYDSSLKKFTLTGGGPLVIDSERSYFFEGDLDIKVSSTKFSGEGILEATGNVIIGGNSLDTSNGSAFIYSRDKSISIGLGATGGAAPFVGTLYAPSGSIDLKGNNINIQGCVAAKELDSLPGDLTITYSNEGAETAKELVPKVHYSDIVTQAAISFIGALQEPARVGVIKYDESANNNLDVNGNPDFKLYDSVSDFPIVKNKLYSIMPSNSGKSNLGDGLRRAYEMLDNGNQAAKYIVVLTGSKPNRWTVNQDTQDFYTDTGNAPQNSAKEDSDSLNQSIAYAETIGNMAVGKSITPLFVNCMPPSAPEDPDFPEYNFRTVDTALKAIVNDIKETNAGNNLDETDNLYFSVDSGSISKFKDDLSSIINAKISKEVEDKIPLSDVRFTFTIPAGVEVVYDIGVVGDTELNPGWVEDTEKENELGYATKKIYKLTTPAYLEYLNESNNTYSYKLEPISFKFVVKYVKNDPQKSIRNYNENVAFSPNDSISFSINDNGNTIPFSKKLGVLNVNVTYQIDIN